MNKIEEHKNFLPNDFLQTLKTLIFNDHFPWAVRGGMTDTDKNSFLTHFFYTDHRIVSQEYDTYIVPILRNLKCKAVVQVRANLFFSHLFKKSDWHVDNFFNCTTSILYLNTCNGGTELKINDEIKFIKAEENKLLVFSSDTLHRVCTSTNAERRYILNFNYFK